MADTHHQSEWKDDLEPALRLLRAIEQDRSLLTSITSDQRKELLTLAGLVSKPERHDLVKMAKAFRRAERQSSRQRDRQAIEQSGLRLQRRAEEYTPLWLPLPDESSSVEGAARLVDERACYVCKTPYLEVHRYYEIGRAHV